MTKSTIIALVFILVIGASATVFFTDAVNGGIYKEALSKSMYSVLVREDFVNPNQLKEKDFKKNVVSKVIPENMPITSDMEIERQADLVIKELVAQGLNTQDIGKEFIMNMIKIEYHVMNRKNKAGKALVD